MFNVSNEFQAVLICNLVENAKEYQYFSIFCNFLHIFFRIEPPGQKVQIIFKKMKLLYIFCNFGKFQVKSTNIPVTTLFQILNAFSRSLRNPYKFALLSVTET